MSDAADWTGIPDSVRRLVEAYGRSEYDRGYLDDFEDSGDLTALCDALRPAMADARRLDWLLTALTDEKWYDLPSSLHDWRPVDEKYVHPRSLRAAIDAAADHGGRT